MGGGVDRVGDGTSMKDMGARFGAGIGGGAAEEEGASVSSTSKGLACAIGTFVNAFEFDDEGTVRFSTNTSANARPWSLYDKQEGRSRT